MHGLEYSLERQQALGFGKVCTGLGLSTLSLLDRSAQQQLCPDLQLTRPVRARGATGGHEFDGGIPRLLI